LTAAAILAAVYVFWGATAPAMRFLVETLPPWTVAALRFFCAGAILWTYARFRGVPMPTRHDWYGATVTGTLQFPLGNAIFMWSLQYIPSGVGALVFSLSPLWMVLIEFLFLGRKLARQAAAGLVLGFAGMFVLVWPSSALGVIHWPLVPTLLCIWSSLAWAAGSVAQRRFGGTDLVQASAMQMLVASVIVEAMALAAGERPSLAAVTPATVGAFAFLVILGSVVGYSCFLWVMRHLPTAIASTYSYVNPLVAILIGVALLHETFTARIAIAAGVILAGVALMLSAPPRADAGPALGTAPPLVEA
jgi:drug/metabolite transporter (DMT)-like permease